MAGIVEKTSRRATSLRKTPSNATSEEIQRGLCRIETLGRFRTRTAVEANVLLVVVVVVVRSEWPAIPQRATVVVRNAQLPQEETEAVSQSSARRDAVSDLGSSEFQMVPRHAHSRAVVGIVKWPRQEAVVIIGFAQNRGRGEEMSFNSDDEGLMSQAPSSLRYLCRCASASSLVWPAPEIWGRSTSRLVRNGIRWHVTQALA